MRIINNSVIKNENKILEMFQSYGKSSNKKQSKIISITNEENNQLQVGSNQGIIFVNENLIEKSLYSKN